eukprot:10737384-Lingulodinium_polyedra.AAC.1
MATWPTLAALHHARALPALLTSPRRRFPRPPGTALAPLALSRSQARQRANPAGRRLRRPS